MAEAVPTDRLPSGSRDLIPYGAETRQVVLRRGNTVVLLDKHSRQLTATSLDPDECPYCHRPYEDLSQTSSDEHFPADDANFVSPQYFRQLAASIPDSANDSGHVSPTRRMAPLPPAAGSRTASTSSDATPIPDPAPPSGSRISSDAFSQGYFDRFFVVQRELGRGGRGIVMLVTHVLDRVELGQFACKRIPVGDSHVWLEKVLMEVTMLQNISHENLVPYRHVWLEDFRPTTFAPSTPHVFILQQFCNSGTLFEFVMGAKQDAKSKTEQLRERARRYSRTGVAADAPPRQSRRLQFDEIFAFFKDITSGLAHLHANGYVHRDLKPQNCLLHLTGTALRVLVSDFGEMQGADTPRQASATGYTGTVSFSAPEILTRDASGNFGDFTAKSDVFSLGMIVFFMCFSRLPYNHADLEEEKEDLGQLKSEILNWAGLRDDRQERPDLPEKLYDFLELLLSRDPADRPSTDAILQAIRAESVFSEFGAASPLKEQFEPPDRYAEQQYHPNSPDMPAMRRRSVKGDKPHNRSFSTDKPRPRLHRSPELRPPSSPHDKAVRRDDDADMAIIEESPLRERSRGRPRPIPMLMAPPDRRWTRWKRRVTAIVESHTAVRMAKLAAFLLKIWSLSAVCTPALADPLVAYPLLALAGLDLLGVAPVWPGSVLLVLMHGVVLQGLHQADALCGAREAPFERPG